MSPETQPAMPGADRLERPEVIPTRGYAANDPSALVPFSFTRRSPRPEDVQIQILYCGVCHSDLHQVRDEWRNVMPTMYPCVPGHEIVGRVVKVGGAVQKFKEGDIAAVGCMVDSCGVCSSCLAGEEQFCLNIPTLTYNSPDKISGGITYGGYSETIVVKEKFVLRVPKSLAIAAAAPLLCAGITTYSPLRHWKVGPGKKVGVVGLGGLGHMALKFSRAFGAHTVLFTRSAGKADDAMRLGADEVVVSKNMDEMQKHARSFDFILDTAAAPHDLNEYLALLRLNGVMTLIGGVDKPAPVAAFNLILGRHSLAGSMIGGIRETQEMLDFCGEHGITSDVEVIAIQKINEAYERLAKSDVKYRFVIDMSSLQAA